MNCIKLFPLDSFSPPSVFSDPPSLPAMAIRRIHYIHLFHKSFIPLPQFCTNRRKYTLLHNAVCKCIAKAQTLSLRCRQVAALKPGAPPLQVNPPLQQRSFAKLKRDFVPAAPTAMALPCVKLFRSNRFAAWLCQWRRSRLSRGVKRKKLWMNVRHEKFRRQK